MASHPSQSDGPSNEEAADCKAATVCRTSYSVQVVIISAGSMKRHFFWSDVFGQGCWSINLSFLWLFQLVGLLVPVGLSMS